MRKCDQCGYDLSFDAAHVCKNWQLREGLGIPPQPEQKLSDILDADLPPHLRPAHTSVTDNVNHPAHYNAGAVECIDAIEAALTPEEYRGFLKGNILKYTWREKHKGGMEAMRKARWYLNRLLGAKP